MMGLQTAKDSNDQLAFKTRFGEVSYTENAVLDFPNGLLGMPNQDKFFIAKMPVEKLKNFQVMQSLVEDEISFAILPHDFLDEGLEAQDIAEIKAVMEIKGDELLIMLIAGIQQTASGARLSVNLRAPVFINTNTKEAYQIVLANNKYQVQHFLG
jgi:flagellar assembly factor FliW